MQNPQSSSGNAIDRPGLDQPGNERVIRQRQQELELFIRQTPADSGAYLELAKIYRSQDRHYDAIRVLEKAVGYLPDDLVIRWELEEAQLARALQRLQTSQEILLQSPSAEHEEDLERARIDWAVRRADVCRARLSRTPGDAKLQVLLAESLRDLGAFDESMQMAEAAASSLEHAPMANYVRGQCLLALGRPLEALSAWRAAALRRAVPAPEGIKFAALKSAINLALKHGLYASAERYLLELQRARPNDASIAETLARVKQMTADADADMVPQIDINPEGS